MSQAEDFFSGNRESVQVRCSSSPPRPTSDSHHARTSLGSRRRCAPGDTAELGSSSEIPRRSGVRCGEAAAGRHACTETRRAEARGAAWAPQGTRGAERPPLAFPAGDTGAPRQVLGAFQRRRGEAGPSAPRGCCDKSHASVGIEILPSHPSLCAWDKPPSSAKVRGSKAPHY